VENSTIEVFDQVAWYADRAVLGDQVFRLQHFKNDDTWDLGDDHFVFFKVHELVNQYRAFFARRHDFRPRNVLELGIWDGGSTVFWFEIFRPDKHVAIDIDRRGDSEQFTRFVRERALADRLRTRWSIDQSDRDALRSLVRDEFAWPLDLVIDDASHFYEPTRASFEALFPRLREGGLYLIEDWAWGHWRDFHPPNPMSEDEPLTRFVLDLVQAAGTSAGVIRNVDVCSGFVAVERGEEALDVDDFALDNHICSLPSHWSFVASRGGDKRKSLWSRGRSLFGSLVA
jgi:Methyltransferase domain